MKVIVINGHAETGKDKFVKIFKDISGFRVKNISSVDKVKSIAEICFGWNGKKDDKSRKFLSEMKRIWAEFNDGPTNDILNKIEIDTKYCIEKDKNTNNNVYFLHIREPEEIEKIKDVYGDNCITILIRKNNDSIPDNNSDRNVENYKYQYIVNNNGNLNQLIKEVKKFYKKFS
jgi:hypothetical protein